MHASPSPRAEASCRPISGILAIGVLLLLSLLTLATASDASAKQATTKLTIQVWPEGVFGTVKSKDRDCSESRRVVVFRERGKKRVERIGSARAKRVGKVDRWALGTRKRGSFYAKAPASRKCSRAITGKVRALPRGGAESADAPPCSPWVSQGGSAVCKLAEIQASINRVCRFGGSSGNCYGEAVRGSFPWGVQTTGGAPSVGIIFDHDKHTFQYYANSTFGTATLNGTLASSSSPNLVITDALATNELGGENGDRFYTPQLPGQRAGEMGGPLYLNWDAHSNDSADVYIRGYLYLKP